MESWRKKCQSKKNFLFWNTGDDVGKMQHKGKNDRSNFDDKESFSLSNKMQSFPPHLLDEN